jgi:hypothetical protein
MAGPGAGVSANVVFRYTRGNSAGPSNAPLGAAAATATVKLWVAELDAESLTLAVKEYSPVWVVVPANAPVADCNAMPTGSAPAEIAH